ncbi:amidohydrolase/deacetylase family metallohydrolase [Daejeonella sp. H1SJ63]|uniref:amidohydrolase/deacetylase family metallohydrolase n=1 Tax=Daejeonella sp. H1SJ63 TaxID=3034145 RepID=UPI0023ED7EB8|nr:amidohydrolase/deacetylase family metallohydrolase [Daejeonella sp. H1SJ63]
MLKNSLILLLLLFASGSRLLAQGQNSKQKIYGIVIKGGHVIDSKSNLNELMDIAIQTAPANRQGQSALEPRIVLIAKNIDTALAIQVVDARGMYVTPGLIDIHTHVFYGPSKNDYLSNGSISVVPDNYTFRTGVTTVVDAGGAGWKSFQTFKKNIIDISATRVLSMLNIVGEGMRGGAFEQNMDDMDADKTAAAALENKEYVVGFKLAHFGKADWTPVERLTKAGRMADMPVMVDFGSGNQSLEELFFKYLRPGDIYTHSYCYVPGVREPIINTETHEVKPFVRKAQQNGLIFDVGFGSGSFDYRTAIPAIKAGFYPNTLGTDLHASSINGAMKDQMNVFSVFLNLGMDIPSIIKAATWAPAQAIKREELGNLTVGGIADIAVLSMRKGNFGFKDIAGNRQPGDRRFECQLTIKGGKVVYDLNAIASKPLKVD